jgi:diguanylate cyclase (GGDEF)-like protein
MDERVKGYAETLYENTCVESAKTMAWDRKQHLAMFAHRLQNAPLSGNDVSHVIDMYVRHIERCMMGKLDSYQKAFTESNQVPSEEELQKIWSECKEVYEMKMAHALISIMDFIRSHGGAPYIPQNGDVEGRVAHAHDRALQQWKIWRAKTQLKPASSVQPTVREKQIDKLMGLHNRAEFDDELVSLCGKSGPQAPLSLLFMDLDKFKSINDGPGGHEAGDRALKLFADAVRVATQRKGTAFRYGGDEVCVLLPNHTLDEAFAVGARIRTAVSTIRGDGFPDGLSTSIGVATLHETTFDPTKLCPQGDKAMYASKRAGGNRATKSETEEKAASNVSAVSMPNPAEWT